MSDKENNKEEKKIRKLSDLDSTLVRKIKEKYQLIKQKCGSHSPGASIIEKEIPEIKLNIDCCFLSNPYATEIFEKRLKVAISDDQWLYGQIESYPAQNAQIAEYVAKAIGIKSENIFIGNGATEIISALLNRFVKGKILIMLPTFSPFYEYVNKNTTEIHYYPLVKDKNRFYCDIDRLLIYCNVNDINNIVVINPNNPDGSLIEKGTMKDFLWKDAKTNTSYVVKEGKKNSKLAELDYDTVKYDKEQELSVVKIDLHTGRHHQIRVQFSSRMHAIYGDSKYHGRGAGTGICLWAYELTINHPTTKEEMTFTQLPSKNGMWRLL